MPGQRIDAVFARGPDGYPAVGYVLACLLEILQRCGELLIADFDSFLET